MQRILIYLIKLISFNLFLFIGCHKDDNDNNISNEPPVIDTEPITMITSNSAKSGGNILKSDSPITDRGVCWREESTPTIFDNKTSDGTGIGSFTSKIDSLKANTIYYIRAFAINKAGISYGATKTFTTPCIIDNTFTDSRDGSTYKTITIGNQVWMAENLRYLPVVFDEDTFSYSKPFYYVYRYKGTNIDEAKSSKIYKTFGVLYNWEAAKAAIPVGWHLPSDAEWTQLTNFLGGEHKAGPRLMVQGLNEWSWIYNGATNETCFTALPGGLIDHSFSPGWFSEGSSDLLFEKGFWWSNTISKSILVAYSRNLSFKDFIIGKDSSLTYNGLSVRCVKD